MSGDLTERRVQAIARLLAKIAGSSQVTIHAPQWQLLGHASLEDYVEHRWCFMILDARSIIAVDPATGLLGLAATLADEAANHLHTKQDMSRIGELARALLSRSDVAA